MGTDIDIIDYFIKPVYNKTLYTYKSSMLSDSLETKYVNLNYEKLSNYIQEVIFGKIKNEGHSFQYKLKKSDGTIRPIYIDDFINDIAYTDTIATIGRVLDILQDDSISFGNRIESDLEKPNILKPYFEQYFKKLKRSELENILIYDRYYKIDLKKFYNNIDHNKLKEIARKNLIFNESIFLNRVECFLKDDILECEKGRGLRQNNNFSHMLANLYLSEFDNWFKEKYPDAKLIRYVDDISIFVNDSEHAEDMLIECENYLKSELNLEINESKKMFGNTDDLIWGKSDNYFEDTQKLSMFILRTLYKIDDMDYFKYSQNPKKFLKIYSKCLNKLGINISVDWLNIKIEKELKVFNKIREKFSDEYNMINWIRKNNIYDMDFSYIGIPDNDSEESINEWVSCFINSNYEFVLQIMHLRKSFENKINYIIDNIRLDRENIKKYSREINYTLNKMKVFRCGNIGKVIEEIDDNLTYVNKSFLSNYKDGYKFAKREVEKKDFDKNSYEYLISIWLLGEYKNLEAQSLLEKKFIETISCDNFINTLVTEALLKINNPSNSFISVLKGYIGIFKDYYKVRNILLILNTIMDIQEVLKDINIYEYDERTKIFVEWILKNKNTNIIEELDDIDETYKKNYPDSLEDIDYYICQ